MPSEEPYAKSGKGGEDKTATTTATASYPIPLVGTGAPTWDNLTESQKASLESLHQAMPKPPSQAGHDTAPSQSTGAQHSPQSPEHSRPRMPSVDNGNKPPVGSDEWHRVRRENHKQVERRRRETINDGINEIARLVPGCEKNKGSILQRAAQYIQQLKDDNNALTQKWTIDKLVTDQAISQLNGQIESLKQQVEEYRAAAHHQPPEKRLKVDSAGGNEQNGGR